MENCELTDLGYSGSKYTWKNCRDGGNFIKERLDRGVANQQWRDLFPEAAVKVEFSMGSDHLPIILSLDGKYRGHRRRPGFRYDASWAFEEGFNDLVKQA